MTTIRITEFLSQLDKFTLYGDIKQYSQEVIKSNRKTVNLLCKKELDYLRKNVESKTLRRYRSDYRNAVRQHYIGKELALTHTPKNDDIAGHIALKYFRLKKTEVTEYSKSERDRKINYLSGNRILINNEDNKMTQIAIKLLNSEKVYEIAIGLLFLTGRRSIEILKSANFIYADENTVIFTGQAKTREAILSNDNYEVYVLCDSQLICDALIKLRNLKDFTNLDNRKVESSTSGPLGQAVRKHFNGFLKMSNDGTLSNLRDYKGIETKALRDIWLNIAHERFEPLSDIHYFATRQLGHISGSTASNYMEFMLIKNI